MGSTERFDTVVVGGGQAGLVAGKCIKEHTDSLVILEGNERVGDSWRKRWDSLRLFTPARFCELPDLSFPGRAARFPTKDEMGDYLEAYAERFALPVRTGVRVSKLAKKGDAYVVTTATRRIVADNVVVASGACQTPRVPAFAADLDRAIVQLHSSEYKGPSQLSDGGVLVVGLGNSGAEIAAETCRTHTTYVSGKPSAQIPFKHSERSGRIAFPVIRFLGHHVLTLRTPIGRKAQPKFLSRAAPLIRVKTKDLEAAGAELVGRTIGTSGGRPATDDGRTLDVGNVIWCTGFSHSFDWIDIPVFADDGRPLHTRGIVEDSPGLYFMGLEFQYAASSGVLPGVGRDAAFIAKHIRSQAADQHRRSLVNA